MRPAAAQVRIWIDDQTSRGLYPDRLPRPLGGAVPITFWVIYDHPDDAPDAFALRPQWSFVDGLILASQAAWFAPDIKTLRAVIPFAAVNIGRQMHDDPKIAEVWIE